jgi:imidazolonepropionase-like amidohydrolase
MRPVFAARAVVSGLLVLAALPLAVPAQDLALTNANVVDVVSGRIQEGVTILVVAGRIERVGETASLPAGTRVIDLAGRYVAPGLMDAHVHISSLDHARRALESGITTARSMGTAHYADVGIARLASTGNVQAPEIIPAGYHVRPSAAEAFFLDHPDLARFLGGRMKGEEALRAMVRAQVARGVAFIKTNATERAGLPDTDPRVQLYSEAELRAIVQQAVSAGIPVAAHAHGDAGARAAVLAGVRSIEHGTYLSPETLRLMAERGTFVVPTIAIVRDLTLPGGDYDDPVLMVRGRHMLPRVIEMTRSARELGVRIVAATDTGYGPESTTRISHELEELVNTGMSPLDALRAATTISADLFGIASRTGRIQSGFEADLIVLERNPLEDIRTVHDILIVINNGVIAARKGDWPPDRT